ncbi:transposase [Amycolatopsis sp. FDAARGOS 1241]|nr:transposase [Amycolatopsis sp. FDAARGOS 1241]
MRTRRIHFVSPEPDDRITRRAANGSRGGRPPAFDAETEQHRTVVVRCVNRLEQLRDLATRYTNRAACYQAELTLTALILWLRYLTGQDLVRQPGLELRHESPVVVAQAIQVDLPRQFVARFAVEQVLDRLARHGVRVEVRDQQIVEHRVRHRDPVLRGVQPVPHDGPVLHRARARDLDVFAHRLSLAPATAGNGRDEMLPGSVARCSASRRDFPGGVGYFGLPAGLPSRGPGPRSRR